MTCWCGVGATGGTAWLLLIPCGESALGLHSKPLIALIAASVLGSSSGTLLADPVFTSSSGGALITDGVIADCGIASDSFGGVSVGVMNVFLMNSIVCCVNDCGVFNHDCVMRHG